MLRLNVSQMGDFAEKAVPMERRVNGFVDKEILYNPLMSVTQNLSSNIDLIEQDILNGMSFREISERYQTSLTRIFDWKKTSEHSARIATALEMSAEYLAEMSRTVLEQAIDYEEDDGNIEKKRTGNMAKSTYVKELAQYYRWKAAKRAPKAFGDNKTSDINLNVKQSVSADQFGALLNTIKATAVIRKIAIQEDEEEDIEDAEEIN